MADWDISETSLVCAGCESTFQEEQELFSALYDEQASFARRDYCPNCWESVDKGEAFSFWRTRIPRKEQKNRQFVDDETLMDFFRRLENEESRGKRNFRYVLSLLLMRKKLLRFRTGIRSEGGEELVLYEPKSHVEHRVYDPQLAEDEIEQVREQIGQVLNVKL